MLRTYVIVLHCTIFKTSCSGIHGIPPLSFSRDRIDFLVNPVYSVKCMSVSKPLALIYRLLYSVAATQPFHWKKPSKKIRVDIFVCKFYRYLNNNSAYRNTTASAEDWKRPEKSKGYDGEGSLISGELNQVQRSCYCFEVSWLLYVTQKVPDSGHWLCSRILYWPQVKQLLFLCAVLNDCVF